jgi:hypothetical protein
MSARVFSFLACTYLMIAITAGSNDKGDASVDFSVDAAALAKEGTKVEERRGHPGTRGSEKDKGKPECGKLLGKRENRPSSKRTNYRTSYRTSGRRKRRARE